LETIEVKVPKYINQFINDTNSIQIPTLSAIFKIGKRQWAEYEFVVDCQPEEEEAEAEEEPDEMMLVITTVPAITAVNRLIKHE
jgi:hypothetical protein